MRLGRALMVLACLASIPLAASKEGLVEGKRTLIHSYEIGRSASPDRRWEFYMTSGHSEDEDPTMWLADRSNPKDSLSFGKLFRDGEVTWCPNSRCVVLLEQPSIEYVRLRIYLLTQAGFTPLRGLDKAIWKSVQASIGKNSEIIFDDLEILGWISPHQLLLAARARFIKSGINAPAYGFTGGFIVDIVNGQIAYSLREEDLKAKYGYSKPPL
jgi:hypothetical protein